MRERQETSCIGDLQCEQMEGCRRKQRRGSDPNCCSVCLWRTGRLRRAESPIYLENDPPYGYCFPDQIEPNARGIHETMYDTLPERI
jgi:hypothetical protein